MEYVAPKNACRCGPPEVSPASKPPSITNLGDWKCGFLRFADADGRLLMAILACRELRLEVAPMTRAQLVAVVPGVLRMMLLRRTG